MSNSVTTLPKGFRSLSSLKINGSEEIEPSPEPELEDVEINFINS